MQRGAKQRTENPTKFWSFSRGQFVRRVEEGTKDAVSRVLTMGPNEGKTVWEIVMDEVTGQLVGCKIKDGEYDKSFQLILDVTEDENDPAFFAIDFKFNGSGKNLLKKLPNIDLSEDVAFVCYTMDGTNKKGEPIKNHYAVPYQGEISKNGKVLPAYTKDEPNGFPEMKTIKVKGKDTWDDTEQLDFLEDLINSTPWPGTPENEKPNQPQTEKEEVKEEVATDDPLEAPESDDPGF